jgi:hypothetical protein
VDRATRIDDNGRDRCVPVQAVSDSSDTIPTRDWFRSSVDQKGGSAPPPKQAIFQSPTTLVCVDPRC